jgi:hypothetical protein
MTAQALKLIDQPAWLTATRSPARLALADLQAGLTLAEDEAGRLKVPFERAKAALADTEAAARDCDDAVRAIDAEEVGALVATAQTGDRTGSKVAKEFARRRAEAAKRSGEIAHHVVQGREALAQLIWPYQQAQAVANALRTRFHPLIASVFRDLHREAMQRRDDAIRQLFKSELDARSLAYALSQEGRRLQNLGVDVLPLYQAAGPIAEAFMDAPAYTPPALPDVMAAAERLTAFMARLARDPDARP